MITNLNLIDNENAPDAIEIFKMINGEPYFIQEFDYSWCNLLGYNFHGRNISKHPRFDEIIPGSCEFVSFTPINIHVHQNQRVGNIITFFAKKKSFLGLGKGSESFFIWYEGGNGLIELPLDKYSNEYISRVQERVILEAETFNKRTAEYISKLKKEFKLFIANANGTNNGGRFKGCVTNNGQLAPRLICPDHPTQMFMIDYDNLDKCYFEDLLFKITISDDITGKDVTNKYSVEDLSEIL